MKRCCAYYSLPKKRLDRSGLTSAFATPRSYDLKSEIQKSERSKLDPELARHPAAQQRIAAADKYKRKRPKGENDD